TDILEALQKYIKLEKPVGSTLAHSTLCGIFLAAKYNQSDYVRYFIKVWGEGYLKYWNNYILAEAMRNRESAKYLIKGDLASVFKLSHELIERESKEIIETLSKRINAGRALVYKQLSWKQLLDRISKLAIEQSTIDFSDEILRAKTLGRTPATTAEIKATEQRLKVSFPDDYKKFLLASNGFENFSYTGVTLSFIDKVDFLVNVDEQLVDIWADSMDDVVDGFGDKLKSSIVIGGLEEEQQLLLIPLPNKKWEYWHFSSWNPGEVVYESFRFYVEDELQRLEDNFYAD
ncbi:MAG TPA: SMI1/KNR4 family protein, partial [Chitinophagaceae bacterium]